MYLLLGKTETGVKATIEPLTNDNCKTFYSLKLKFRLERGINDTELIILADDPNLLDFTVEKP